MIDTAIVVPTYNRLSYIKQMVESLRMCDLTGAHIVFVDDKSDEDTIEYLKTLEWDVLFKPKNTLMLSSYIMGFEYSKSKYPTITRFVTLDSDTIHKPNWLFKLRELYDSQRPCVQCIATCFNTKNHKTKECHETYRVKESIGGVNMMFDEEMYTKMKNLPLGESRLWDYKLIEGVRLLCTNPSYIQHIGSEGLNSHGNHDKAEDY
jgi:glycosyltransferase involved in cell wall biosynthesis